MLRFFLAFDGQYREEYFGWPQIFVDGLRWIEVFFTGNGVAEGVANCSIFTASNDNSSFTKYRGGMRVMIFPYISLLGKTTFPSL